MGEGKDNGGDEENKIDLSKLDLSEPGLQKLLEDMNLRFKKTDLQKLLEPYGHRGSGPYISKGYEPEQIFKVCDPLPTSHYVTQDCPTHAAYLATKKRLEDHGFRWVSNAATFSRSSASKCRDDVADMCSNLRSMGQDVVCATAYRVEKPYEQLEGMVAVFARDPKKVQ
jgi:hypothetical protein